MTSEEINLTDNADKKKATCIFKHGISAPNLGFMIKHS